MMFNRFVFFFTGTLRRQLILSVAIVHAVLMILFVFDLTERQTDLLLDRQTDQAVALAQSVATSSSGWVQSKDFSGLQEIISAQSRYPALLFAMILSKDGKVIAHSDTQLLGKFIKDLPATAEMTLLSRTGDLVDAISPIVLGNNTIGWVRIGLGQKATAERMTQITRNGIYYTVIAIIIGTLIAWLLATRLTHKLHRIQHAAESINAGDLTHRIKLDGSDEVATVGKAFNTMMDGLKNAQSELADKNMRLELVMASTGVGIWDWHVQGEAAVFNERWANIIGYTLAELEPVNINTWLKHAHPDDLKESRGMLEAHWKGETEQYLHESRMKHKDGHWVWVLDTGRVVEWQEDGKPYRMIGTHIDITRQKEIEEQLRDQATHDPLTRLANRQQFETHAELAISKAISHQLTGAVIFIDLDRFKPVNDTAGHAAGDELLKRIALLLNDKIRGRDLLARIGGDEFAVLLEDCPIHIAQQIAENMRKAVDEFVFVYAEHSFSIGLSAGITSFGEFDDKLSTVINVADNACQIAKSSGRNAIYTVDHNKDEYIQHKQQVDWLPKINKALADDSFVLFAQEIRALDSEVKGLHYELLLRLKSENGDIIPPFAFLPSAERYDLMQKIDRWVIEAAFKTMDKNNSYSINLSGQSMADNSLGSYIESLIDRYCIDAHKVTFEITETAAIQNFENCMNLIASLKNKGFKFSLDDFGSGLSSFSYLKNMPVDYLKIDGSFVKEIATDNTSYAMVKSINEVAHIMGIKTIAEFVENEDILDKLKEIGIDYAQGYHIHKPEALF